VYKLVAQNHVRVSFDMSECAISPS
jgi:hypothetical protein